MVPDVSQVSQVFRSLSLLLRDYGVDHSPARTTGRLREPGYEGDVDIYVPRSLRAEVLEALGELESVRCWQVHQCAREYMEAHFLAVPPDGNRAGLEIDFIWGITWKGVPVVSSEEILQEWPRGAEEDPVASGTRSLREEGLLFLDGLSKVLHDDLVRGRELWGQVRWVDVGACDTMAKVAGLVGADFHGDLLAWSARGGSVEDLSILGRRLKALLLKRRLSRSPWATAWGAARHLGREVGIAFKRDTVRRIVLLGPDGVGKSTLSRGLCHYTRHWASEVEAIHLKRVMAFRRRVERRGTVTDPYGLAPRGVVTNFAKLTIWLLEAWLGVMTRLPRNARIEFYDRHLVDVVLDPRRVRLRADFRGGTLFLRLLPRVDLYVIMVAGVDVIRARKQEVSRSETQSQVDRYGRFAEDTNNVILLDASDSPQVVLQRAVLSIGAALRSRDREAGSGPT